MQRSQGAKVLNKQEAQRPLRGCFFLSLQRYHWFLCEQWGRGPVTKSSQNGKCCFLKERVVMIVSSKKLGSISTASGHWIFVAKSLPVFLCGKIFLGEISSPPQTKIWLYTTMTFTTTPVRESGQNLDSPIRIPYWIGTSFWIPIYNADCFATDMGSSPQAYGDSNVTPNVRSRITARLWSEWTSERHNGTMKRNDETKTYDEPTGVVSD